MATGVLVIGVGKGCRQLTDFLSGSKIYEATAILGTSYDTLDTTGRVISKDVITAVSLEEMQRVADEKFTGNIMQRPPAFSAIRINGQRSYEIARKRQKEEIEQSTQETISQSHQPVLEERPVTVHSFRIQSVDSKGFAIRVECGGGTYIRSLIVDLAAAFGQLAAMDSLVRIKQGSFHLDQAIRLDEQPDALEVVHLQGILK